MIKLNKNLEFLEKNKCSKNLLKDTDLCDFNHALFKCENEELNNTFNKRGNYEFQKY